MIIKNPYRYTEKIPVSELIPTCRGVLTAEQWCISEAKRLVSKGIPARAIKRLTCCYVIRSSEGCKIDKQDEDLINTEV
jgi:hypothetical protein